MDYFAVVAGVAGAIAEVPMAAVAYSAPARGGIRIPPRWWRGTPAPPTAVFVASLLAGVSAWAVTVSLPWSLATPAYWLFPVLGVGLAIIDVRCRRLPHVVTGTLWGASVLGLVAESAASSHFRVLAVGAAAGASLIVFALVVAFALPGQLGLGDVSLLGVIAFSLGGLGVEAVAVGLFAGFALQAGIALGCAIRNRHLGPSRLPFGPALLTGWIFALLICAS